MDPLGHESSSLEIVTHQREETPEECDFPHIPFVLYEVNTEVALGLELLPIHERVVG